jgi:SNF2-related domain/Helicase conserved C-terminal domain
MTNAATTYADFLARKIQRARHLGPDVPASALHPSLHPWQARIVSWSVATGRAAIWADTGLGKTRMQIEWARLSGATTLIVAPLAVCAQTVREGAEINVVISYVRHQDEITGPGVWITNYEMVDRFDPTALDAVVLDESSILKDFTSKTRDLLIEQFRDVPRRLCCSATPAPNDVAELANHAEFLGVASRREMLSTYFVHDQDGWRPKGHARGPMFAWMATWAVALRRPSDIGYPDDGYVLPPLDVQSHLVDVDLEVEGQLFPTDLGGVSGRAKVRRSTLTARVDRAVQLTYDCGPECVQPGVLRSAQGEVGALAGREGAPERPATEALRGGQGTPRGRQVAGEGVPAASAASAEGIDLRADEGPGRDDARPGLSGVQCESASRPDGETPHRPRPSDGHGPRCSLSALQSGAGAPGGRSDSDHGSLRLPHACRDQWVIWCGLNDEQDALVRAFGDECRSIDGRTPVEARVEIDQAWRRGDFRILVVKPGMYSFGMNWQHCARMIFVGLSDSYEQYYQAIRRCYRYGQTRPVQVHIILSDLEGQIATNITRKEREAARFTAELVESMRSGSEWSSAA